RVLFLSPPTSGKSGYPPRSGPLHHEFIACPAHRSGGRVGGDQPARLRRLRVEPLEQQCTSGSNQQPDPPFLDDLLILPDKDALIITQGREPDHPFCLIP